MPATDPAAELHLETEDESGMVWFAEQLAASLEPFPATGLVIDLRGDLGAGKTTWTRALAHALGVPAGTRVVSPTFTLIRSYPLAHPAIEVLQHFDAYRLTGALELPDLGFDELCGAGCLTCVEWGERIEDELPGDRMQIEISVPAHAKAGRDDEGCLQAPTARSVVVRASGPASARVERRVRAALRDAVCPPGVRVDLDSRPASA